MFHKKFNEKDIKFKNYQYNGETRSKFQTSIAELVKSLYPNYIILVDYPIGEKHLSLDIFLPRLNLAIEVDGRQHYKFNKFFHSDIRSFKRQKQNDQYKDNWCISNGIKLIRINNENITQQELFKKINE